MILVDSIEVAGGHQPLLPKTSLHVRPGELMLVETGTPLASTTMGLVLAGRMYPSAGTVTLTRLPEEDEVPAHSAKAAIKYLRRHSALIDSPQITEPERFFTVEKFVSQELAMLPRAARSNTSQWLAEHGFTEQATAWIEQLSVADRLQLVTRLAVADAAVRALVYDAPDRHGHPDQWLPTLQELHEQTGLTTIALINSVPSGWNGPTALAGAVTPPTEHTPES